MYNINAFVKIVNVIFPVPSLHVQCGMALHRRCMEVCLLECDNRRGTVFGVDLTLLPHESPDGVPFLVLRCTSEIESRALSLQVFFTIL